MTRKLIVKIKTKEDPPDAAKPSASKPGRPLTNRSAAGRAAPAPRRSHSEGSGAHVKLFIFVVAALGLAMAFCLLLNSNRPQSRGVARTRVARPGAPKEQPTRYRDLGGLTMAEWEKKYNRDNDTLKARRERIRQYNATTTE